MAQSIPTNKRVKLHHHDDENNKFNLIFLNPASFPHLIKLLADHLDAADLFSLRKVSPRAEAAVDAVIPRVKQIFETRRKWLNPLEYKVVEDKSFGSATIDTMAEDDFIVDGDLHPDTEQNRELCDGKSSVVQIFHPREDLLFISRSHSDRVRRFRRSPSAVRRQFEVVEGDGMVSSGLHFGSGDDDKTLIVYNNGDGAKERDSLFAYRLNDFHQKQNLLETAGEKDLITVFGCDVKLKTSGRMKTKKEMKALRVWGTSAQHRGLVKDIYFNGAPAAHSRLVYQFECVSKGDANFTVVADSLLEMSCKFGRLRCKCHCLKLGLILWEKTFKDEQQIRLKLTPFSVLLSIKGVVKEYLLKDGSEHDLLGPETAEGGRCWDILNGSKLDDLWKCSWKSFDSAERFVLLAEEKTLWNFVYDAKNRRVVSKIGPNAFPKAAFEGRLREKKLIQLESFGLFIIENWRNHMAVIDLWGEKPDTLLYPSLKKVKYLDYLIVDKSEVNPCIYKVDIRKKDIVRMKFIKAIQ